MKKKRYGTALISMLLVWAVVGWMTFDSNQDPQPAVEYRAVCRNLPANAHWTSWGTRKEIPQTESSPNVWTPSPVGTYNTSTKDTECHFVCDGGFEWDNSNKTCNKSSKWMCDMNAVCDGNDIAMGDYTIKACNLGTSTAGTWVESYGCYYQRGNNYGFANTGALDSTSSTKQNASGYGPSNPYNSGTFITVSKSPYSRADPQNENLRWGSSSDWPTAISTGQDATNRQWPCPDGYHVPRIGEWNQLLIARASANGVILSDSNGYKYFSGVANVTKFRNDFLLPLAGNRSNKDATVSSQESNGYYRSSTPSTYARYLYLSTSDVYAYLNEYRAKGLPLRCFKDS